MQQTSARGSGRESDAGRGSGARDARGEAEAEQRSEQGRSGQGRQDTAERAVDAAVLWMRAERRCQVLARFEVPVRVLAPSRPHQNQIALSTAMVNQQRRLLLLVLLQLRLRLRL